MRSTINRSAHYIVFILLLLHLSAGTSAANDELFENYIIDPRHIPEAAYPDSFGIELIQNGGFEDHDGIIGAGWRDDSAWAPVKTEYAIETNDVFNGKASQKIQCKSSEGGFVSCAQGGISIGNEKTYSISFSAKGDIALEVVLRKGSHPYTYYATEMVNIKNEWGKYAIQIASSFSDDKAALYFILNQVGTVYIDNVPEDIIPDTLFGLHINYASKKTPVPPQSPWPFAQFGIWRLWESYVSWPRLETEKNKWYLDVLDDNLALAKEHAVRLIIPLAFSPTWASSRPDQLSAYNKKADSSKDGLGWAAYPRNIEDFRNYVRIIAERSKGSGNFYEIWNEPNASVFFSGTVDELITLHKEAHMILKQIDPTGMVISSPPVNGISYLDRLLAAGLADYCDIIGIHLYTEAQDSIYNCQKLLMINSRRAHQTLKKYKVTKPLWNTESGWLIESDNFNNYPKKCTRLFRSRGGGAYRPGLCRKLGM